MNTEQFEELRRHMVMEIAATTVMVGERNSQQLILVEKSAGDGKLAMREILPVSFSALKGA